MLLRWVFHDEDAPEAGSLSDWTFPVNPATMQAPEIIEAVSAEPMNVDGTNRDTVQPQAPSQWTWDGVLYSLADLGTLEAWMNHGRPIHVTDHFNRTWRVQLVDINALRNGSRNFPERHKYTASALMMGRVLP